MLKSNILFSTHKNSKQILGKKLWRRVQLLIPITLIVNILELFSVLILFPLIQLLLNPDIFSSNKIISRFFNFLHVPSEKEAILVSFLFLLVIFLTKNILFYFVLKKQSKIQFQIATEAVMFRYKNYLQENHSFHDKNNVAILLRNVTQIPYEFVSFILIPYINIINELVILLIISIVVFIYDPILFGSISLFAIPTAFIYTRVYKQKLAEISAQRDTYSSLQYKMALDTLKNFTEIKIFQATNFFVPKFRTISKEFESSMAQSNLLNVFSAKIIETIAITSIVLVVLLGYFLNMPSASLLNFLILFAVISFRIIPSLNKLVLSINYIKGSSHVLNHLKFDTKNETTTNSEDKPVAMPFHNSIEVKSLQFSYKKQNENILNDLNLTIKKGEKIGIIGESGSGKSTFLSIILRFINQTKGDIFVDGQKLDNNNLLNWYNIISYVPQSVQLINGTVAQNIAFGIDDEMIDYGKIKKIISSLNLNSFIEGLPEGLDSNLGENNNSISGGQKQRIGIARALYYDRQVVILDEATSALDSATEKSVINELHHIENLTVIFVTHRAKALANFDRIYKLENGTLKQVVI